MLSDVKSGEDFVTLKYNNVLYQRYLISNLGRLYDNAYR